MKHLLTLCMLALCLCASAKETCPKVIPALQEWKGGSGKLALPAEGSIVIASADEAALKSVADVLAQDLKDLLGWNYTVRTGNRGTPHRPVRECSGAPEACCRYFITKRGSCPRALPVTGRSIPTAVLCWMWAASSSRWTSCANMSRSSRSTN